MDLLIWIGGGSVGVLALRWAWIYFARRRYDRELDHRIRNRRDLRNLQ